MPEQDKALRFPGVRGSLKDVYRQEYIDMPKDKCNEIAVCIKMAGHHWAYEIYGYHSVIVVLLCHPSFSKYEKWYIS